MCGSRPEADAVTASGGTDGGVDALPGGDQRAALVDRVEQVGVEAALVGAAGGGRVAPGRARPPTTPTGRVWKYGSARRVGGHRVDPDQRRADRRAVRGR